MEYRERAVWFIDSYSILAVPAVNTALEYTIKVEKLSAYCINDNAWLIGKTELWGMLTWVMGSMLYDTDCAMDLRDLPDIQWVDYNQSGSRY